MQASNMQAYSEVSDGLLSEITAAALGSLEADVSGLVRDLAAAWHGPDAASFLCVAQKLAGVAASFGATQLEALARYASAPAGVCGSDLLDAIQAEASVALAEVRQVYKALQA
jgi:hypothetical protein